MSAPNLIPAPTAGTDTKSGVVLRVLFFVFAVCITEAVAGRVVYLVFQSAILGGMLATFTAGLLANFLTIRIFDRRNLTDIGLGSAPGSGRNLLIGLVLGAVGASLVLGIPLVLRLAHFSARPDTPQSGAGSLIFYLAVFLFGAAGEEAIFHGYAFQLLMEKMGVFATILPVGALFGLAHGLNPNASKLGILNTVLWGILLGYAFFRSHDLWLPIGIHYSWNAVLPLFGANLSGIPIEITRYSYRWNLGGSSGDLGSLLGGGAYGPEGGLLTSALTILLIYGLRKAPVVPQFAAIAKVLNEPEA